MRIVSEKSFIEIEPSKITDVDLVIENVEESEDSDERITTYALVFRTEKFDYIARYVTNVFFFNETQDEFMELLIQKVSSIINECKNELKYLDLKSQEIDVKSLFETYINASFYAQLDMASEMYSVSRAAGIKVVESGSYEDDYKDDEDDIFCCNACRDEEDDYICPTCEENLQFERFYERMVPRIEKLIKQMKINGEI